MNNSKDRMIELLCNKFRKRILELDRDAARLNLVNKTAASMTVRRAVISLQTAIADLEG